MRSDSSSCTTHSDSGFVNRRLRPVRGSRRLSVLFQTQRPDVLLVVAGAGSPSPATSPSRERIRPGTSSSFSMRTIRVSESPSAYALKIRRTTAASRGSISIR